MLYLGPPWVSHRNLLWKLSLEEKKNKKKPLKVGKKLMKIMASASSYNNFSEKSLSLILFLHLKKSNLNT